MDFNQGHANILIRSKAMFGSIWVDTGFKDEMLMLFPIMAAEYSADAADVLAQALMSATRFHASMNLWIDVQQPHIPEFVAAAIASCRAFGMRLVVTHYGACSHVPGEPLAGALITLVARASQTRQVWHPLAKRMVPSIRHLASSAGYRFA